jgi:ubiquinol-cytochrome c reductase cytochrome c subunit
MREDAVDAGPAPRRRRRRRRYLPGLAGLLAVAAVPGAVAVVPPAGHVGPPLAAPAPAPAAPAGGTGQRLYQQNCVSCHGVGGEGTQRGPSLRGVGPASTDFQLSTGRMPLQGEEYEPLHRRARFSPTEIRAIVDYVAGFGGGATGPAIPAVRPGPVDDGRRLYAARCAACHSATGVGATLANGQIAPSLMRATATQVGEAVRVGPGLMPAFPDSLLGPDELDAIVGYVRVLQNRHGNLDRGGVSMGRVGPFMEGLVAWVVGMFALLAAVRRMGSRAGE